LSVLPYIIYRLSVKKMKMEVMVFKQVEIDDKHVHKIQKIIEDGSIGSFADAVEYVRQISQEFDYATSKAIVQYIDSE